MDQVALTVENLTEDLQCQIFSNVTKLDDVLELEQISLSFNRVGKACITRLEGNNIEIDVDFLLQFPNLRYLEGITVVMKTVDGATKMAQLSDLQKAIFFLDGKPWNVNQDIFDTYVNLLCANSNKSLIGRQLYFLIPNLLMRLKSTGIAKIQPDIIALESTKVWFATTRGQYNPRALLDCTGLREVYALYYAMRYIKENELRRKIGDDVKIIAYERPFLWLTDDTLALLRSLPYPDDLLKNLNVFNNHLINQMDLGLLFKYGLKNQGASSTPYIIEIPEPTLNILKTRNERLSRNSEIGHGSLLDVLNAYNELPNDRLVKMYSPNLSQKELEEIDADSELIRKVTYGPYKYIFKQKPSSLGAYE